jgi:multiple sugar transport system substrate-binding protein
MGYLGLTWDHPRGRVALEESAEIFRRTAALELSWDVHSLEGFESSPISELAERYDLIVLDHPHLGDALETASLRPLDEIFDGSELEKWAAAAIDRAWRSYEIDGHAWALPLDAATQVAVFATDLVDTTPTTWDEVDALADRVPVALSLAGPHAVLTFSSICVAFGEEPAGSAREFVSRATGLSALDRMRSLAGRAPAGSESLNPIEMLEVMSTTDSIAYCPLVFGYVNYAGSQRLTFADAPSAEAGGRPGSTLGGTGLALTRRSEPSPALIDYFRWLLSEQVQRDFVPRNEGQPARRSAWDDDGLNRRTGDFYRNTRRTIDQAWIRPRYSGYVSFQTVASGIVRAVVAGECDPDAGLAEINRIHSAHGGRPDEEARERTR